MHNEDFQEGHRHSFWRRASYPIQGIVAGSLAGVLFSLLMSSGEWLLESAFAFAFFG